jgi:hypothetical protein
MSASHQAFPGFPMTVLTGCAALLTTLWATLMFGLLSSGSASYTFPHRFPHDIDSPVLALELAREKSEVDAVLHRNDSAEAHARAKRALRLHTVLDLVFIPLYVTYLVLLAQLCGGVRQWVLIAIIGAAIFDYLEDVLIFSTLNGAGPLEFIPSLVKWGLLAVAFIGIGASLLRGAATVYSFATHALLGLAHLAAAALILLAIACGWFLGYSWLELGTKLFAIAVLVNVAGLLGPLVARWFPGSDITYIDDFCRKRQMGLISGPAVRTSSVSEATKKEGE